MNCVGKVFWGQREKGKTTRLYNIAKKYLSQGKRVLVIDSATDHEEKSLFCRLKKRYPQEAFIIGQCEKEKIIFPGSLSDEAYPPEDTIQTAFLYLCDASYYLEKGYLYPAGLRRDQERLWYKRFSMQVIQRLLRKVDVILLDEIELIPESREVLKAIFYRHIVFYMTLHYLDSIHGMGDLLTIERL